MRLGERSETVIDRFGGPSDFNMPWMNARADLIGAQLLLGDFSPIERTGSDVGGRVGERGLGAVARERAAGGQPRGAGVRARAVRRRRDVEPRARELAIRGRRRKYEANASITLGRRSRARGRGATAELRSAVALSDELGSPLTRWQARAALVEVERKASGGDAEGHAREVTEIIDSVVQACPRSERRPTGRPTPSSRRSTWPVRSDRRGLAPLGTPLPRGA